MDLWAGAAAHDARAPAGTASVSQSVSQQSANRDAVTVRQWQLRGVLASQAEEATVNERVLSAYKEAVLLKAVPVTLQDIDSECRCSDITKGRCIDSEADQTQ